MPLPPDDAHFQFAADAARDGKLTVFLGAGANYSQQPNRTLRANYTDSSAFLPTGAELAAYLAQAFGYQVPAWVDAALRQPCGVGACASADQLKAVLRDLHQNDLGKVAQQIQSRGKSKSAQLTKKLFDIFSRDYPTTSLHKVLAHAASTCTGDWRPIFVTTNYDTMMEQALADIDVPFDVVYYRVPGPAAQEIPLYHWKNADKFYKLNAAARLIEGPKQVDHEIPINVAEGYSALPLGTRADTRPARTLVVKIHGTVSPKGWEKSSFIISADDYIQFLRLVSVNTPLPAELVKRLIETHFLFLGYGLSDWNILAICQGLWSKQDVGNYTNSAIQYEPPPEDERRWASQEGEIELFDQDVSDYARKLAAKLPP